MERVPTEALLLRVILILFWLVAIICWWATLWHVDTFARLGANLPTSTILVKESAKVGAPFIVAGVFTAVTLYVKFRQSHRMLLVSAWLLCIAFAFSMVVMIGITSPMTKLCGEFVPGWPSIVESLVGRENSEVAATVLAATECTQ